MAEPTEDERSLFTLIGELPDRVSTLVRAEIDQIKAELGYKAKHFGIGAALFVAAAFVAIFLLGTIIATVIIALSLVMPLWAAALTVCGVLTLIIAVLIAIGLASFRRGSEPLESIESLKRDLDVVKGTGEYEHH
ncbi:phage holin family protein [Agromyces sp. MMS24-JH15]|uniref:phage holin family protein n=1 Tax=Agromyces sp. MMS24-JH15 TaxID=3243765 RepID=UPI00374A75C9